MAKQRVKRYDIRISGKETIEGRKPNAKKAVSIDEFVEPCSDWFDRLETRCVRGCCGLSAFALTDQEVRAAIPKEQRLVASEALTDLVMNVGRVDSHSVRSSILASVSERETFLRVIGHIACRLRESS